MNKYYYLLILLGIGFSSNAQQYKDMIISGEYTVWQIQEAAEKHFEIVGTERGNGYKPYKRWEYKALRSMDDSGMLRTSEFYFNELERYNSYLNENFSGARTTVGQWEEMGPTAWNATSGWNPGVGRITSIAVDNGNTDHIIIGAVSGGVWKTLDGGVTWTVLTDNLSNIRVTALTIDPTNSSTYFWGANSGSIFKSTDGGATWNLFSDTGFGNVNKILIDPTNTTKMYTSVEGGGIYKSTDSGATWSSIHPEATTGYDLEFKPGNTQVIYASGTKVFKSIDGGATFSVAEGASFDFSQWTQNQLSGSSDWIWTASTIIQNGSVSPRTGNGMALFVVGNYSAPITRLESSELDLSSATAPELKFSYTQAAWQGDQDELRVLYKTSAGGTWTELASYTANITAWSDITLSLPNVSSDYYIAFEGTANYGYGITLDDVSVEDTTLGVVFSEGFEAPPGPNEFSTGPKMIGVSEGASGTDADVVYVLEAAGGIFGGFHRSLDGGDTFTKLNHGTNNYFGYSSTANDTRGQAPRDMDIAVHPNNVDEVHIAGILSWRSIDGGTSFNITSQWVPGNAAAQNIGYCHADIDLMMFVGTDLYVGSDGGIFVAENTGTVNSSYYRDLTAGLGIRQFYKIGISQSSPAIVTGGAQDNGTSVLNATGNWRDWLGADGMESFVDKTNSNIMYGTSQYGTLYKSTNGGSSYFGLSKPDGKSGNWVTPIEQDPLLQDVVYGGYDYVYKSTNGGSTWSAISQQFVNNLNHLKIAPSSNLVMYSAWGGNLFKTTDGGVTNWTQLSGFSGSINSIAIHPTDPNKVAIATTSSSKVYVSTNGGSTWTSYRYNLPNFSAYALTWNDNGDDGLYVGMNYGIYYIDNTFTDWQPFSNGLPNVEISELEINRVEKKIYAATYGRGLWRSNIYDMTLSNEDFALKGISLSPNPANDHIRISWKESEDVSVRVYNALGKLLYFKTDQNLINDHIVDVSNYSSGLYFIKINNSRGEVTKKVIVQ